MRIELNTIDRDGDGPLYKQLKELLRGAILSGVYKPGQRMESQLEFMKHGKLSGRTVSRAFKELVDEGLVVRKESVGTFVAESAPPKKKRRRTIAMALRDFGNEIYARIFRGFNDECVPHGYRCQPLAFGLGEDDRENRALHQVWQQDICGVLTAPDETTTRHRELIRLIGSNVPVVLVMELVPGIENDLVTVDNEEATYRLTGHLLKLGHTRIGYISTGFKYPYGAALLTRAAGVRRAMREWGFEMDEDNVIMPTTGLDRAWSEIRRQAVETLLGRPASRRPTAIMCSTDPLARQVVRLLNGFGVRVPEDISVTGFDDVSSAVDEEPHLTTVHVPYERIGRAAASLFLRRVLHPRTSPTERVLDASVVLRHSTARPPG